MSKKLSILLIASALVVGIAIGVVGTLGIQSHNDNRGAIRNIIEIYDLNEDITALRQSCEKVTRFDEQLNDLVNDLFDTLYSQGDGAVGISAPQVGVYKQVCVIDTGSKKLELINPKVVAQSGEQIGYEGCLSFPSVFREVNRPMNITVEAVDRNGNPIKIVENGFTAGAIMHQIDHLNGKLILDYMDQ